MKKNIFSSIIQLVLCFIASYILHRMLTANLVMYFLPSAYSYVFTHIYLIIIQGISIFLVIKQTLNRSLDRMSLFIIWSLYFSILVFILFFRMFGIKGVNLNPLALINDINIYSTIILFLNILIFVPLGYLFKNQGLAKVFIIGLLIFIAIETLQYVFSVGIFDIDDIILNMMGLLLGYKLSKSYKITK